MKKILITLGLLSTVSSFAGQVGNYTGINAHGENCSLDISLSVNDNNIEVVEQTIYPSSKYLLNPMSMAKYSFDKKIEAGMTELESFGSKSSGVFTQYQEVLRVQVKDKQLVSYSVARIKHSLLGSQNKWEEVYKCSFN